MNPIPTSGAPAPQVVVGSPLRRRLLLVVPLLLMVVAVVVGITVLTVHQQYGEWSLTPSAAPPRLGFEGRSYTRSELSRPLDPQSVVVGHAAGGDLYGPANRRYAPTVLQLRTGSTVATYALAGGP